MPLRPGKRLIDTINQRLMQSIVLNPVDTGYITDRVAAVRTDTANFYIFRQDGYILCFDTGYRRRVIRSELSMLGIRPSEVTHVFLTHADIDHVLGLGLFRNAALYLSAAEERLFRGLRPPRRAVRTPRIRRPYSLLRDGDEVRVGAATVRAIETPGHTPGSMSYLLDGAYLFTGDTCKFADGVAYAGSRYTMDIKTQKASIKKLAGLTGVRYVFTAHSGYTEDFETAFGCWR
jgi:hydroxyacylglutathione hydrolase